MSTIERGLRQIAKEDAEAPEVWGLTGRLRWFQTGSPEGTHSVRILQQEWQGHTTGKTEWHAVPVE